jgi:hypothetical protein
MGTDLMPPQSKGTLPWTLSVLLLAIVFEFATFSVINGTAAPTWDAVSFFAPAYSLIADHARSGRLALWNPWENGGSPEYAEPELGAASPFTITIGAMTGGTAWGFCAYWLLIWFLGPLGILVLARYWGSPPWAGFVVALGFAFSGFYTGHAEHLSSLYSISWLPWFLWRFDVALASHRLRPAIEAGALWGLSALGGYPQLTILSAGFMFLWAIGRWWSSDPGLRPSLSFGLSALALVGIVGVLVLSPSYVAFFTEAGSGYSDRAGPRSRDESITSNATDVGAFATFASPYLTTLKVYNNPAIWPLTDLPFTNVYLGAPITILALLALIHRPKSWWRWWLAGVSILFLACAVGWQLPVRGWLYDYCPPTRYFRNPGLFRVYAMLCAAFLALLTGKDLQDAIDNSTSKIWTKLAFTSVTVTAGALFFYVYVQSKALNFGDLLFTAHLHFVSAWFGFTAAASVLLRLPRTRRFLAVCLGALAVIDASLAFQVSKPIVYSDHLGWQLWNEVYTRHRTNLNLAGDGLMRAPRPPDWIGFHDNNENVPMKTATLFNYGAMSNRFHKDFEAHPVLTNMSTGNGRVWLSSDVVTAAPTDAFYAAFLKRSEALAMPVLVVHPPSEMAKISERSLTTPADMENSAAVSRLPGARRVAAQVNRYTPNHLELEVYCSQEGWLLVTDRWARGWRAIVNGQPAPVFGGNFIFRAVRVKAGPNSVQFHYRPAGWPILLILSWGTLAFVFAGPRRVPKRFRTDLVY